MTAGFPTKSRNVLFVEGVSDRNFISQFCDRLELDLKFDIEVKDGLPRLLGAIFSEVVTGNRDVIGIMVDADREDDPSWPKISMRLRESGILVPLQPDINGTVIAETDERPKVGIWVMPDNKCYGELENFVIGMIPDDDMVWPMSKRYVDSIPENERQFRVHKTDRAKLYAWLATRKNPPHIGSAVRAGDLDTDTELSKSFARWLVRLFTNV